MHTLVTPSMMPEQLQPFPLLFEVDEGGARASYNRAGPVVGNDPNRE